MPIIDSHMQFWNLDEVEYPWLTKDHGILNRTYEAPDVEPQLRTAGVVKAVLVQADNSYENNAFMLKTADQTDWISAVVGWVDLLDPADVERRLTMYGRHPKFRGVRHLLHYETDPNWIIQKRVVESLRVVAEHNMVFDLAAQFPDHLKYVADLAEAAPTLKIVIDHLARPPMQGAQHALWNEQLRAAAEAPTVYAKLSGLTVGVNRQKRSAAEIKPFVDFAFEAFGADRLMYGSDWPTCLLAGTYANVWVATSRALEGRSRAEITSILGDTCARVYQIH